MKRLIEWGIPRLVVAAAIPKIRPQNIGDTHSKT
jgi:hypothetical protein